MEQDNFQMCLKALQNSTNDTEKFAALLLVTKAVNPAQLTDIQNHALFKAIGFSFLHRLLVTDQTLEDCAPCLFRSIGLTIFASFCGNPEVVNHDKLPEIVDVLKDVISSGSPEDPMFKDALQCICALSAHAKCVKHLVEKNLPGCLVDVYSKCSCKVVLHVLLVLCSICQGNAWIADSDAFHRLMSKLSEEFERDSTLDKFEIGEGLLALLGSNADSKVMEYPLNRWCFQVREGLRVILQNKLQKPQRDMALKLACVAVEKFGTYWIVEETDSSNKFFSVLVHVICIEIRVCLEDADVDAILQNADLLTTCFSILENVIVILSDEYVWHMSDENAPNAPQLLGAIQSAFTAVTRFLSTVSDQWDLIRSDTSDRASRIRQLTLACVRILSAWMAEESLALQRTNVCEVLPFLVHVAMDSVGELKHAKPNTVLLGIDVTRFLMPSLCHITADDMSRALFLKESGHVLIYDYLQYVWDRAPSNLASMTEDDETWIATVCGVLLNIVVMERDAVTRLQGGVFLALLKFLFSTMPQLPGGSDCTTIKANFATLGLLTVRYYVSDIDHLETSFYKFLCASIKFLWDSHHVEFTNDALSLVLVREYRKSWNNIAELWFLSMQVLASLLPVIPWISTFLLESGWPQHIISCLLRIGESNIDPSTRSSYQNLLCAVVQHAPEAADVFLKHGAESVCRVHNLQELKALLSSKLL